MKKVIGITLLLVAAAVLLALPLSYKRWEEGWKEKIGPRSNGNVPLLLKHADILIQQADTREKVHELISTYEKVLAIEPDNYKALWSLGRYLILLGAGYSDRCDEKLTHYLRAIRFCERGMYTNRQFRSLVDQGEPVWEAARALTRREIASLYYWYAGIGWIYTECLSDLEKLANLPWVFRTKKIMRYMMDIDPEWAGGHPYSAWASYYAILPPLVGGDRKKAAEYFEKAISAGPNWLYIKYGRARFLYLKAGDREAFERDLRWVIDQNPRTTDSPYPWNIYFQRHARKMLADMDILFD